MIRRTTIEIDQELLSMAKRALGATTTRATVEEALRLAVDAADAQFQDRRRRQLEYLDSLPRHIDVDVLLSGEMWR